jgi:16S rRNA (uracil1498-N3)-methyltransferase
LLERVAGRPESPLAITLVQGVSRGERMDWTVQKATELGVCMIAPVLTARSVVRLDARQARRSCVTGRASSSPRASNRAAA